VKLASVSVAASIARSNVALTVVVFKASLEPLAGTIAETVGGTGGGAVLESVLSPPLHPASNAPAASGNSQANPRPRGPVDGAFA
jgi:hypothetical protein